jgi:hypothetical protein
LPESRKDSTDSTKILLVAPATVIPKLVHTLPHSLTPSLTMDYSVLSNTVAPLLGTVICVMMYCSPVKAVMLARRRVSLGSLNAIPFGE